MKINVKLMVALLASIMVFFACSKNEEPEPIDNQYDSLVISKNKVTLEKGEKEVVKIEKGSGTYEVSNSDKTKVTATLFGEEITLKALEKGNVIITVKDIKTEQTQKISVEVTLKSPDLEVAEKAVTVQEGKTSSVKISAGSGAYEVSSSDTSKATVTLNNNSVVIKGISKGTATVTVTDKKTKQTKKIAVTVTEDVAKQPYVEMKTLRAVGSKIKLTIDADKAKRSSVWIDLNNNSVKDSGEQVTSFSAKRNDEVSYVLGSQTVRLYGEVSFLFASGNHLTEVDVTHNNTLEKLSFANNKLTKIDVAKNTKLIELYCDYNDLKALDVTKNINLKALSFEGNKITSIDLSNNAQLQGVVAEKNQLTELDVTHCPKLSFLYFTANKIKNIDVSKNPKLFYIYCDKNPISKLDFSQNNMLVSIDCSNTLITELDLSKNVNIVLLFL